MLYKSILVRNMLNDIVNKNQLILFAFHRHITHKISGHKASIIPMLGKKSGSLSDPFLQTVNACHPTAKFGKRQQIPPFATTHLQNPVARTDLTYLTDIIQIIFTGRLRQFVEISLSVQMSFLHKECFCFFLKRRKFTTSFDRKSHRKPYICAKEKLFSPSCSRLAH